MSPKKITQLGLLIGVASIVPLLFSIIFWGTWSWWAAAGLGLALLLFAISFLKGAYMVSQQRAEMVDKLNDCYTGKVEVEEVN